MTDLSLMTTPDDAQAPQAPGPSCTADRHPVGLPYSLDGRQQQLRLVGTKFLRLRPWLVGASLLLAAAVLSWAGASSAQLVPMSVGVCVMEAFFIFEALWLRRRPLSSRWLMSSLAITLVGISVGCVMSGGLLSPALPLLLAPVVVAFAAFGHGRISVAFGIGLAASLVLLGAMTALMPTNPLPPHALPPLRGLIIALVLALAFAGVAGLSEAYTQAILASERASLRLIEQARQHAVEIDAVGAQVAHEIKNPLAAIKGLTQLVRRAQDLPQRHHERLEVVSQELERVERLLQDYLGATRHLSGLLLTSVAARECVQGLKALLQTHEHAAKLIIDDTLDVSWQVRVDLSQLRQALLNLLLNALEAQPVSRVILSVQPHEHGLRFVIDDDGQGMTLATASSYGQPVASQKARGSGLGVLVARQIAQQHGGRLELLSTTPGQGTRVALWLPATKE